MQPEMVYFIFVCLLNSISFENLWYRLPIGRATSVHTHTRVRKDTYTHIYIYMYQRLISVKDKARENDQELIVDLIKASLVMIS